MKHGVAFRKFSRTSSHRMLMLRNLVTSLIEHEQIKTTLPKARDTARLAEKLITLGKKGDLPAARRAQGFLLQHTLIPKVFGMLAHRYAHRPGGYTRIHKFGNRRGDNAPHAILELVDNPRDLRFEMTARAVGWELLGNALSRGPQHVITSGVPGVEEVIKQEKSATKPGFLHEGLGGRLRRVTQENLKKVLRYRSNVGVKELSVKAETHIVRHACYLGVLALYTHRVNLQSTEAINCGTIEPPQSSSGL
ncbi:ribosomal protein L17 [Phellopilus nigrolimitatus]|nr:ribosomal protein L17 [Phellopilus nigrolimitatus]